MRIRNFRFPQNVFIAGCLAFGISASPFGSGIVLAENATPVSSPFVVEGRLQKNVGFWIKIYSEYSTHQGVIHDTKYLDKIFEVIDLDAKRGGRSQSSREARARWSKLLLKVHAKRLDPAGMDASERRVYDMYADVTEADKFLNAAHRRRLRFQVGQREPFLEGLKMSGQYLGHMERIFRKEGLPVELTRLPFVESSFNVKARSKVGATGIWQFIRATGKMFLRIDADVDERNDPIRATEAAAKLLQANYDSLHTWPLAVTAYNHGRTSLMRAVRQVGSDDFERIYSEYRGRTFGFASSNYYACLLAAIEVERNSERYFGKFERAKPLRFIEFGMRDGMRLRELARFMKLNLKELQELNPGLTNEVLASRIDVPPGYALRLPHTGNLSAAAEMRVFQAGYAKIPRAFKRKAQRGKKYDKAHGTSSI